VFTGSATRLPRETVLIFKEFLGSGILYEEGLIKRISTATTLGGAGFQVVHVVVGCTRLRLLSPRLYGVMAQ
jgi:hypothetical protein